MTHMPKKSELRDRIIKHLAYRNNSEQAQLLWKGYLAGLMEWGLLSDVDYHELDNMIGDAAEEVRVEIFVGYPGQYD
jgi:hypothetical protein